MFDNNNPTGAQKTIQELISLAADGKDGRRWIATNFFKFFPSTLEKSRILIMVCSSLENKP